MGYRKLKKASAKRKLVTPTMEPSPKVEKEALVKMEMEPPKLKNNKVLAIEPPKLENNKVLAIEPPKLENQVAVQEEEPPTKQSKMEHRYNYVLPEFEFHCNDLPWAQNPSVPPAGLKPKILSVVGSANFSEEFNLEEISKRGINLSFNSGSFTPLVMRLQEPVATGMLFKSGKMVVTGTQSVGECFLAVRKFSADISAILGRQVKYLGLRIQNITASCNVGFKIRVADLGKEAADISGFHVHYQPDMFTGVSLTIGQPQAKVRIFRTGSVLLTGIRSEADMEIVFRAVYPLLHMYAKYLN